MTGSFKADWRKLRTRPAPLIMAGLLLVAVVLIGYVIPNTTLTHPTSGLRSDIGLTAAQQLSGLYPKVFVQHGLAGLFPVASTMALIFGALNVGSEI